MRGKDLGQSTLNGATDRQQQPANGKTYSDREIHAAERTLFGELGISAYSPPQPANGQVVQLRSEREPSGEDQPDLSAAERKLFGDPRQETA